MNESVELPVNISVQEAHSLLSNSESIVFVDCREPDEYETAKIDGTVLIPLSEFADRASELEPHKNDHLIIHCHHGGRSLRVTNWLRQQGFQRVQNMAGGIDQWSLEIDDSILRY
ncbi:Thiosulfate sulfurtransferase PspE precursor [Thalassoglobus neptunius]|uniref:Thiosulfate sulfurtransferase PspE n=1 Tax=Thalassoglobus neptunius TaxID=1938619 RepID=A0A5C5X2Q1_9PLAN|nr:rhodanese-like domain-containing protein [Thalassoglobus neptunius]TWT57394.1 Thiosulfate sulfurtransferase PspE precursor [Thalassoglobus neptunius]